MATFCKSISIRPFIGAKNFDASRSFYIDLGYKEVYISSKLVLFKVNEKLSFYLQDYYDKSWIDNSMLFLEVDNIQESYRDIKARNLSEKYKSVRLSDIVTEVWGQEFFLHDPSGILWHIGTFSDTEGSAS